MAIVTSITNAFRLGLMNNSSDFVGQYKVSLLKSGVETDGTTASIINGVTNYSQIPLNLFVDGFGPIVSTADRLLKNTNNGTTTPAFSAIQAPTGIQIKTVSGDSSPFDFTDLITNISLGLIVYEVSTGLICVISSFGSLVGVGTIKFPNDVMCELR